MRKMRLSTRKHFPKDLDLAFAILFTLSCIPFVLIPALNDTFFYKKRYYSNVIP
jgi:hypothetical protein